MKWFYSVLLVVAAVFLGAVSCSGGGGGGSEQAAQASPVTPEEFGSMQKAFVIQSNGQLCTLRNRSSVQADTMQVYCPNALFELVSSSYGCEV